MCRCTGTHAAPVPALGTVPVCGAEKEQKMYYSGECGGGGCVVLLGRSGLSGCGRAERCANALCAFFSFRQFLCFPPLFTVPSSSHQAIEGGGGAFASGVGQGVHDVSRVGRPRFGSMTSGAAGCAARASSQRAAVPVKRGGVVSPGVAPQVLDSIEDV